MNLFAITCYCHMAINLSIKKYLLLAAGLLFCGAAKAAETATYTWDFSSTAAVMGGTATGNFNTAQDAEKGTVLTGSTFDERGTNVFREMLNGALSGEGTMNITMDISWGGNNSLENIIHVARSGFGFSLGLSNGAVAINSGQSLLRRSNRRSRTDGKYVDKRNR